MGKEIQMNIPRCCYWALVVWCRRFYKTRSNFSENDFDCHKRIKHTQSKNKYIWADQSAATAFDYNNLVNNDTVVQEVEMYYYTTVDSTSSMLFRSCWGHWNGSTILYTCRWTMGKKSGWRVLGRFVNGKKIHRTNITYQLVLKRLCYLLFFSCREDETYIDRLSLAARDQRGKDDVNPSALFIFLFFNRCFWLCLWRLCGLERAAISRLFYRSQGFSIYARIVWSKEPAGSVAPQIRRV